MNNISKQLQKSKNPEGQQVKFAGLKITIGRNAVKNSPSTDKETIKAIEKINKKSLFSFGF